MGANWQDNEAWPIFSEEDSNDLFRRSVVKEYEHKKPRHIADAEAYAEWKQEAHAKAAAHHLRGMKAAQGSGDMEQARKHGAMYQLHMQKLGHSPYEAPPEIVKRFSQEAKPKVMYSFKGHPGDTLLPVPVTAPVEKE